MKCYLLFVALLLCGFAATSQVSSKITSITPLTMDTIANPLTYTNAGLDTTYNWGIAPPYDSVPTLTGFFVARNSDTVPYTYLTGLTSTIAVRRVEADLLNPLGDLTLVWVQGDATSAPETRNLYADYEPDMQTFLNHHIYNKGADNLFDNTAVPNHNNIERMDWILPAGYAATDTAQVGFPIFERGASGSHDKFAIAAILRLNGGVPDSFSAVRHVATLDYGDVGPAVAYRVLKGTVPGDLYDVSGNSQSRGGVFIRYSDLGIKPNELVYGYSLFGFDVPIGAPSDSLVDWNNATYYPTNTNAGNGGIDLLAITGIGVADAVLPTRFMTFNAVENNDIVNLNWVVENEISVSKYEVERSVDGVHYVKVNEILSPENSGASKTYSIPDNVAGVPSRQLFYRIKQYDQNGSYYYSNTIAIRRNNKTASIIVYPNPASDYLYVNIASISNDKGILSVTNSSGARISSQQIKLFNGNNSFTVDRFRGLPGGIYQLSIKLDSGRTIVKQFSKQ